MTVLQALSGRMWLKSVSRSPLLPFVTCLIIAAPFLKLGLNLIY